MIGERISYLLGLTGPTYNIDSACSSSHFAMIEAYRMIRSGICDAAIVASSQINLHPLVTQGFFVLGTCLKNHSIQDYCIIFFNN